MKQTIAAVAVLYAMTVASFAAEIPKAGDVAPQFELASAEGKQTSLESFRGKWVVLYFYPKDFTGGCTIQAKNFQRDLAKYAERNAVIVGVSVDSAASHASFCEKEGLTFTLLSDPDAKVSEMYNSILEYNGARLSARNTFLIDPQGRIAKVFTSVKPTGHSEDVLAVLDLLQKDT